jgi:hypothetical protein
MPIEGTMANRHIDYIGYIGGLIYADMENPIFVMICFRGYPAVSVGILGLIKVYLIFNEIYEFS